MREELSLSINILFFLSIFFVKISYVKSKLGSLIEKKKDFTLLLLLTQKLVL